MVPNTSSDLIGLTSDIVSAFVSNNTVRPAELPELINAVYNSLNGVGTPTIIEGTAPELKPAVSVKKSITDDYIICLDNGKRFKSLKRHLSSLGTTPDEYRAKWGLPRDYPMVAPGYAAKRSELAKASGLGNGRRNGASVAQPSAPPPVVHPEPAAEAVEAPAKKRGRPRKAA